MMRRIIDGEPVFHSHECSDDRRGEKMTSEELHNFAVQVLMDEYSDTNAEVVRYDKTESNEADFYFINHGKRPNFSVGASGEKKVNVLVAIKEEADRDISGVDTSWLIDEYLRTGAIPRITLVYSWCFSEDESCVNNGKPAICGGTFCFKYYSFSPLPDEDNQPLERKLSDVELANKYAESWRQYDASIIAPYLDKDFHYASDWVFDELPSRKEYIDYFTAKLTSLEPNAIKIGIGRNHQTGDVAVIILQGKTLSALNLSINDGRIVAACMKEYDKKYKLIDPEDELYMNHGDHLDCIMPANTLMTNYLHTIIQSAKSWRRTRALVTTSDMYEKKTDVFSLMYGEDDIRLLVTVAANKSNNTNEFMSIYPFGNGVSVEVKIDKIIEWDNQIEATIFGSIGEFEFAFFAIDYYCNKNKYKVGECINVDLSALGISVEEAQRGFQFEGQQAIDWLAKIGEKPSYDENGNVEPVKFSMEKLVAFLNKDSKCPDEAEFQSPVAEIESTSLLGVDFYKTMVTICRRDTEEGELVVSLPLYFRQDFFPSVQKDDPIRGWLWITGFITGQHDKRDDNYPEANRLAEIGAGFEEFMHQQDFRNFDNLMFVLPELPLLRIRTGYELDAFEKGDDHGWIIQPYCHTDGAFEYYKPTGLDGVGERNKFDSIFGIKKKETHVENKSVHVPYNDSLIIHGRLCWDEADDVPPILPYFDVPFTEEGIMQAWLLNNLTDFMPKGWHANYSVKYFVFDIERIEELFPEVTPEPDGLSNSLKHDRMDVRDKLMVLDLESLLPKVTITGDNAVLEYAFWNDWTGMVKASVKVERKDNSVVFGHPETEVLVKYKCGIKF